MIYVSMNIIIFEQRAFGRVERTIAFILGFSVAGTVLYGLLRNSQIVNIIGTIISILLITLYISVFIVSIWFILFILGILPRHKIKVYTKGIEFKNNLTFQKSFYTWDNIEKIEKQIQLIMYGSQICYVYFFFVKNKKFKIELLKDETIQLETALINTNRFNFKNKELLGSAINRYNLPDNKIMQIIPKNSKICTKPL